MRILICLPWITVGGAEVVTLKYAQALQQRHQVWLYHLFPPLQERGLLERHAPSLRVKGLLDHPWAIALLWKCNALMLLLGFPNWLERSFRQGLLYRANRAYFRLLLRLLRVELVHSNMYKADLPIADFLSGLPVKFVLTTHGCYEAYRHQRVPFAPVSSRLDGVVYLTEKNLGDLQLGAQPLRQIYNGFLLQEPPPPPLPWDAENPLVVGMVARGQAEKGWEIAIEGFLQACRQTAQPMELWLLGDGGAIPSLRVRYQDYPHIRFMGTVTDVPAYLRQMHLGLLPTYFAAESLPTTLVEYMAYGLPGISTPVGEIPRMLQGPRGICGQLLPLYGGKPRAADLADAILSYVRDPALYTAHRQACAQAVQAFDMEAVLGQYEEFYHEVLGQ